jgi:hypothetical protein
MEHAGRKAKKGNLIVKTRQYDYKGLFSLSDRKGYEVLVQPLKPVAFLFNLLRMLVAFIAILGALGRPALANPTAVRDTAISPPFVPLDFSRPGITETCHTDYCDLSGWEITCSCGRSKSAFWALFGKDRNRYYTTSLDLTRCIGTSSGNLVRQIG